MNVSSMFIDVTGNTESAIGSRKLTTNRLQLTSVIDEKAITEQTKIKYAVTIKFIDCKK